MARPLSRIIDHINIRFGRATLRGDLYHAALAVMEPGDIVLTRTKWRPTNLLLPGRWTHALMAVGEDVLIEATLPCVRLSWLVDVWAGASEVLIVRPLFLDEKQRASVAGYGRTLLGTPYDLEFNPGPRELYCSELIYTSLVAAGGDDVPELRTREFGVMSIRPDAFADTNHFLTLVESK